MSYKNDLARMCILDTWSLKMSVVGRQYEVTEAWLHM